LYVKKTCVLERSTTGKPEKTGYQRSNRNRPVMQIRAGRGLREPNLPRLRGELFCSETTPMACVYKETRLHQIQTQIDCKFSPSHLILCLIHAHHGPIHARHRPPTSESSCQRWESNLAIGFVLSVASIAYQLQSRTFTEYPDGIGVGILSGGD
jgi:hypothetical protein